VVHRAGQQLLAITGNSNISGNAPTLIANRGGSVFDFVFPAATDRDLCSAFDSISGGTEPDAGAAARDEYRHVLKGFHCDVSSPSAHATDARSH